MTASSNKPALAFGEFVTLMAMMIALTALAIDTMLPALPEIGRDLNVSGKNDTQLIIGLIFLGIAIAFDGHPPLYLFMGYLAITLFCNGILFGNLNALAMEPLGHIAGVGAAITSSLSTFLAVPLGVIIGLAYNGTVLPLIAGFGLCGLAALLTQGWTESRRAPGHVD